MTKNERGYIDKHWMIFISRGVLAVLFGLMLIFNYNMGIDVLVMPICVFLLTMGAIDATNAVFNADKKRDWVNCVIDAVIDVLAAIVLLAAGQNDLMAEVMVLAVYTIASGVVDLCHAMLSNEDRTDRFIRLLIGVIGVVIGVVTLNAGKFEMMAFFRFFGTYILMVGITSLIYGVHNRDQGLTYQEELAEAREAKKEAAEKAQKSLWNKIKAMFGTSQKPAPKKAVAAKQIHKTAKTGRGKKK